jgi:hypothetical protein
VADATMIARPLVARELSALLLTREQVDAAMASTTMAMTGMQTSMSDDGATMTPPQCLALDGAAEAKVYAGSGFSAELDQSFNDGDHFTHYLKQAVVLYPLVERAVAVRDDAARSWPACRAFTHLQSGTHWSVGPIDSATATVTVLVSEDHAAAPGWACGRALTVANNVVIDVNTCSANPGDSAAAVAGRIASNVTARW